MNLELELDGFDEEIEKHKGLKKYVQLLADTWFRTPKRIVMTCGLCCLCFFVIGWNLDRLKILDELVVLEVAEYELKDRLGDLELEISGLDSELLEQELQAESTKVFQGFPELAAWTQGLARQAERGGINLSYKVEKAHLSAVPGILEVPVVLEFKATEQAADRLFEGAMQLLGVVLRDHWHIDVISTHGKGNGVALSQVSVKAQLWVRDRFGFVDADSLIQQKSHDQTADGELFDL